MRAPWTVAELKQLGNVPDCLLAALDAPSRKSLPSACAWRIRLPTPPRRWTAREIKLLGRFTDAELSRRLRRTLGEVRMQRVLLKVPPLRARPEFRFWKPSEFKLLGKALDLRLPGVCDGARPRSSSNVPTEDSNVLSKRALGPRGSSLAGHSPGSRNRRPPAAHAPLSPRKAQGRRNSNAPPGGELLEEGRNQTLGNYAGRSSGGATETNRGQCTQQTRGLGRPLASTSHRSVDNRGNKFAWGRD